MRNEALALRYASALFPLAVEQKCAPKVLEELRLVQKTIQGHAELREAIISPSVAISAKQEIIKKVFAQEISELTCHFLMVLLAKGREAILAEVIESFQSLVDDMEKVVEARVCVASPIDDQIEVLISTNLAKLTGMRVNLHVEVQPELLAGAVVNVGERYYDGSLKNYVGEVLTLLKKGV